MRHVRVWTQTREQFREDVTHAKKLLEDVAGQPVHGYRAASWSIDERTSWAHATLREAGYRYSSSVYPIAHDHYGTPTAPAQPFYLESVDMLEIPATTARFAGRNWPAAGGGYFRLFPFAVSTSLLKRARRQLDVPAVFYFHPWELDPAQPRVRGASARARFRHYVNLHRFEPRLKALLGQFRWNRVDKVFCAESAVGS
jgi:polysaccharide deacetylase family protein (PEP-CTERM system associated)